MSHEEGPARRVNFVATRTAHSVNGVVSWQVSLRSRQQWSEAWYFTTSGKMPGQAYGATNLSQLLPTDDPCLIRQTRQPTICDHAKLASLNTFIDNAGLCAAVDSLDTIKEARVGVFTDFGPMPTEAQLSSVLLLAEMATVRNPSIEIAFGAGTSPFAPAIIEKQLVFSLEPAT
jgi:hypothetical protein